MKTNVEKTNSFLWQFWIAILLVSGNMSGLAAEAIWIGPFGVPQPWLSSLNWHKGVFPGETNNIASLNADVAAITNASALTPVVRIDFSASGANGHLALGAVVLNRSSLSPLSARVLPSVSGGTLTLNGATVNGVPNTVLGNRGTGNDTFYLGDANAAFAAVRLGNLTNAVQMGVNKWINVNAVISERNPGSGILLTSDTGEVLADNSGGFSAGFSNTFTGPVRIERGARWVVATNQQALGLSPPDAANLVLDNGILRGQPMEIGRLFTLGPDGGRLEASPGESLVGFAFTNTGAIGFEGAGPRTLTLASDSPSIVSRTGLLSPSVGNASGVGKTSLVKTNDSAIWTLTGSNTYSGDTIIYGGGLKLSGSGSFANSPNIILVGCYLDVSNVIGGANYDGARFALAAGQTLKGNGSVVGAMSVRGGATIAPVDLQTRDLVFTAPNSVLGVKVGLGATVAADFLRVWNAGLDLGGATLDVSLLNAPAVAGAPRTYLLIDNNGLDSITNQFGMVNLSGSNAAAYHATIDYMFTGTDSLGRVGDGNDLAITLGPAIAPSLFNLSINVTNGVATLTWPSVSNQTYWVQYKSALTNANWDELPGEVIATGDMASKADPVGAEARFYRVRTQQQD